MRLKISKSIFYKMLLSYNAVVLLIVFMATSLFDIYSSGEFCRKAVESDGQSLGYLGDYINSDIFEKVENLYVKMTLENSGQRDLFDTSAEHNDPLVANLLFKEISGIVAQNADLLKDMHVYYPNDDTMISTRYGIKNFSGRASVSKEDIDWLGYALQEDVRSSWIGREITNGRADECITLVKKYPFASISGENTVLLAFDVETQKLESIMSNNSSGGLYASAVILDGQGRVISGSIDEKELGSIDELGDVFSRCDFSERNGSFDCKIGGTKSVVSYKEIGRTSWSIVIISSMASFEEAFGKLKSVLWLICMLVIIIGIAMSVFFSRKFYRPIGAVAARIREELADNGAEDEGEHELIDMFVGSLIDRMHALDEIKDSNTSLVKHNLLIRILNNAISVEELDKYLKFIGVELKSSINYVAIITFDKEIYEELSIDTKEFIKFDTISYIENLSEAGTAYIATDTFDENICVLINTDRIEEYIKVRLESIVDYINSSYSQNAFAALGEGGSRGKLYQAYKGALTAGEYHYFMPEEKVLSYNELKSREACELVADESYIGEYEKALDSLNAERAQEVLKKILELLTGGGYSARALNDYLLKLMFTFSSYIKKSNERQDDIREQFMHITDVYQFIAMISSYTEVALMGDKSKTNSVNEHMVSAIKEHCAQNLGGDLSLGAISKVVFVSGRHANKIFKQETGKNITEYVLEARLERARELLVTTNKKVEEISELVGFNTSHYFIKRFKERYNTTPNMYRKYNA